VTTARRTVIITGATGGLGLRAASELAAGTDWHVVITGRDRERTRSAAAELGAEPLLLDLGSLADVRRFAESLSDSERPPLGALVCNAGVQNVSKPEPVLTSDGYEETFAVNHLGHFLLTSLLLDRLTPPARVVVVSSGTHDPALKSGLPDARYTTAADLARPDRSWADGDSPRDAGRRRYATSKLCNILFTYEADRRWGSRGITFNAFDPGMMPGTGLARDYPGYQRLVWRYVMPVLTLRSENINTPRQSGRALARLITDPALEDVSGRYWAGTREIESSTDSHDPTKAQDLWQTSLSLTGLEQG